MAFLTIIEKYIVFFTIFYILLYLLYLLYFLLYLLYFPEGKNIFYGYINQKNIV